MLLPLLLRAAQQRLFSSSVQRSKRARVAVIGSGRMGKIRANLLSAHPRIELVGIVDAFSSQSKESLSKSLFVPFFDSLKDLSSNGVVDGLVVCTPTNTHATVIHDSINSLEGIKGVFVEKPVDENAFKIQSLFETTNKNNIKLCSGFQRRFDPSYASLLQNVHSGKIGQPLSGNIFFGDHPVPSLDFLLQGGDIFMDLSAHDIDFLLQVFQEDPVQSVFASGISGSPELKAAKVYDNATMVLTFESGAVVTIFMSRSANYGYDQRCEIFGSQGMIQVQNINETACVLSDQTGIHHSKYQHSFPQRFHQAFGLEMNAFADTILLEKDWPITQDDCVYVQQIADAAQESCRTGSPVELKSFIIAQQDLWRLKDNDNTIAMT